MQRHHLGEGREQPRAAHVAHTHGRANATIAKAEGGSGTGGGCTNDVAQFEIVDRSALVADLLKHWRPIECCMINILAVKPRAGG